MYHRVVEVHDDGQSVTVLAIRLAPVSEAEARVLKSKGLVANDGTILLVDVENLLCSTDPYRWPSLGSPYPRSLPAAHLYIDRTFDDLPVGVVHRLDVAALLGADLDPNRIATSEDKNFEHNPPAEDDEP
jgi:hypothetical protein